MSNFIIDDSFFDLFNDAKIGVVLLKNINNRKKVNELESILKNASDEAKKYLIEDNFSDNRVIKIYREAYQKFKTKKGARCSIEALLKRIEKGNYLSNINPLVDIYNSISLKYALPVGAEDIDTFVGDLRLTITSGNDEFYLINEEENNPTLDGELCYKDDVGAVCRCFNWRDGKRTMITDDTVNAFCVIELLDNSRIDEFKEALNELSNLSSKYLDCDSFVYILDKDLRSLIIK